MLNFSNHEGTRRTMQEHVKILWVEKTEFPTGWGIKEHAHDYYHLFYVLSGTGVFYVDKKEYRVTRDVCIIIPPKMLHELEKVNCDLLTTYEVKFTVFSQHIQRDLSLLPQVLQGDDFIKTLLSMIVENGLSRLPYYIQAADSSLCTMVNYLARGKQDIAQSKLNSQLIDTTGFSDVTIGIIIFIEKSYADAVTLGMIAESVKYNRNYICSVFKKDTGITIIDYLNYVRIRHASEYFSYSDIDISHVCARVGFKNVSHFNRTFRKFVGFSPSIYKKMFPLDINGNIGKDDHRISVLEGQLLTIAEAFGNLNSAKYIVGANESGK